MSFLMSLSLLKEIHKKGPHDCKLGYLYVKLEGVNCRVQISLQVIVSPQLKQPKLSLILTLGINTMLCIMLKLTVRKERKGKELYLSV